MDVKNPYEDDDFTLEEQYEFLEEQTRFNESMLERCFETFTAEEVNKQLRLIAGLKAIHETLSFYQLVLEVSVETEEEEALEETKCLTS